MFNTRLKLISFLKNKRFLFKSNTTINLGMCYHNTYIHSGYFFVKKKIYPWNMNIPLHQIYITKKKSYLNY